MDCDKNGFRIVAVFVVCFYRCFPACRIRTSVASVVYKEMEKIANSNAVLVVTWTKVAVFFFFFFFFTTAHFAKKTEEVNNMVKAATCWTIGGKNHRVLDSLKRNEKRREYACTHVNRKEATLKKGGESVLPF